MEDKVGIGFIPCLAYQGHSLCGKLLYWFFNKVIIQGEEIMNYKFARIEPLELFLDLPLFYFFSI